MKSLFKCMLVGLISVSSPYAFSADDGSGDTPKVDQPASPIGDVAGSILGTASNGEKTASPPGGAGNDPGLVQKTTNQWDPLGAGPIMCPVTKYKAVITKIQKSAADFQQHSADCRKREDIANSFCLESRNQDIKNFIAIAQVLTAGLSGMMDACNKFGKVMSAANTMLTAYQTTCSTVRGYCNSACGSAVDDLNTINKNKEALINSVVEDAKEQSLKYKTSNPTLSAACDSLAATYAEHVKSNTASIDAELKVDGDYHAVAQKFETCKGYAKELATAGLGLLATLKSFATANKCETATSATPIPTATPVDCTVAENAANNMTCICQAAPRTAGCSSNLDSPLAAKSGDSLRAASGSSYTPTAGGGTISGLGGSGDGLDLASKTPDNGSGSSAPGAPTGGSSGLDGGSMNGGGASGGAAQKAAGLNTNILGGESGGGGGGGWGGYGSDGNPSLRQYLPGGAKDPRANMAGAAASKEVTSQGGKTNWEKVKDRYRDNKPSLLGY